MPALSKANKDLHAAAEEVLERHYHPDRHTTGVALRTDEGDIYTGISLKAATPTADVHAEPIAVSRAILDGASSFDTVVAVQYTSPPDAPISGGNGPSTKIVSPCGACREVLAKQTPDISVILPESAGPVVKMHSEILPY